jgi:hypothetical protein
MFVKQRKVVGLKSTVVMVFLAFSSGMSGRICSFFEEWFNALKA